MIVFIIPVIAVIVWLWSCHCDFGIDFDCIIVSVGVALVGFLIGLLVMFFGNAAVTNADTRIIEYGDTYELVALEDSLGLSTHSFVFSVSADSKPKYIFLYNNEEIGMTMKSIDAEYGHIKYIEENETPTIQCWNYRSPSNILNWLFTPSLTHYTIRVPKGTIHESTYNIDFK